MWLAVASCAYSCFVVIAQCFLGLPILLIELRLGCSDIVSVDVVLFLFMPTICLLVGVPMTIGFIAYHFLGLTYIQYLLSNQIPLH